jgi:predicted flap endonuclease-1-like 5' DNA nuclease
MGFLLAKILMLLVLAAACGGLFTYWWFRRHYQDVTPEYQRARDEWADWRTRFEERLAARPQVDLEPLVGRLAALEAAVSHLDTPERVDLGPLERQLADIERRLVPAPDLAPVNERLMAIEHSLFPVQTRLDELEGAVRSLRVPAAAGVDLGLVLERLGALQSRLEGPPAPAAAGTAAARTGGLNLLSHAAHGKPDDLTQIKGVPKVLERTLHKMGVFYFWQIAEWSPEEVRYVDSQLDSFRGRIERDGWVSQASELAAAPTAAHRPLEH